MEANVEKNGGVTTEKPSLFGVITSPGIQFERIRERPVVWGPLLIVAAIIIVGAVLQGLGTDYSELLKNTNTNGLTAEQVETLGTMTKYTGIIGSILGGIAALFIAPLIYWLCVKISGGVTTYKKMLSLGLFVSLISSLGLLVNGIVAFTTDASSLYSMTSLAGIIHSDMPLASVLNTFEIFSIWSYVLLAIGLHKTGGISKKAGWISVIILFVLLVAFSFISGSISSVAGA
ncbi:toxin SDP protection protein YknW [Bacillus mojavensis]|uniref:Subunit of permease exporting the starvation-induced killing protein n=1 Tax=Bacillus mojavensis TaxID=72360 RepID=A0ABX6LVR0_BACMO|nr:toxin SDP protection protein YknW [Bacillus mojavensis]MEC1678595.1 toxin SDP protection protein YknW [Bacillus mojavensis]MEC1710867.1 toxin SDP protection protein YknW [Bacillus mojavensis]QJC95976.1 Subunit of permease exporting the starvation-induced killing protein [Bacillus mojavensis]